MTWWRDGRDQGVPLWWRICWPAAWLWEQLAGLAREARDDMRAAWVFRGNPEIEVTPRGRELLKQLQERP